MSRLGLQTVPVQSALSLSLSLSLSQEREKCSPLCNVVYVFCLPLLYPEVQTRAKSVLLGSQSLVELSTIKGAALQNKFCNII